MIAFARIGGVPARIRVRAPPGPGRPRPQRAQPRRDRAVHRPALPLRVRLVLLHPGRAGCPREGRHRGRGRPAAPAVRSDPAREEPRRAQPPPGRAEAPSRPHRQPSCHGRPAARSTRRPSGRLAEPFDFARIVPVKVDARSRVCVRQCFYSVPRGTPGGPRPASGAPRSRSHRCRESSPATSGAPSGAPRPWSSTTTSLEILVRKPGRDAHGAGSPSGACSPQRIRRSGSGRVASPVTAAARGPWSRRCSSTGACRSSRSTPRSTPPTGSGLPSALVAIRGPPDQRGARLRSG